MSATSLDLPGAIASPTGVSAVRRNRVAHDRIVTGMLCALVALGFALAVFVGDFPLAPSDVVQSLLSPFTGAASASADFIVQTVRLPRASTAVLTGAAFGLAGIIFQTLLRNPLASPDIVGVSTGASAAAVTVIVLFGLAGWAVAGAAFAGALLTAILNYALAWRRGVSPYRMVLIGIGLTAILQAIISYLFTSARIEIVQKALAWMVGSLNASTFEQVQPLAVAMLLLLPVAWLMLRPLGNLELGDDTARALGTRIELTRLGLLLIAVALVACATAAVGPVAFVAFVAGPIARRLVGASRAAFIAAPLVGAVVMTLSDLIGQHVLPTTQMPVGIVTGALGAVFLIRLLIAANRTGSGG
jgi:iron complex transport system permease protein